MHSPRRRKFVSNEVPLWRCPAHPHSPGDTLKSFRSRRSFISSPLWTPWSPRPDAIRSIKILFPSRHAPTRLLPRVNRRPQRRTHYAPRVLPPRRPQAPCRVARLPEAHVARESEVGVAGILHGDAYCHRASAVCSGVILRMAGKHIRPTLGP